LPIPGDVFPIPLDIQIVSVQVALVLADILGVTGNVHAIPPDVLGADQRSPHSYQHHTASDEP
jgi:hypothetical protein